MVPAPVLYSALTQRKEHRSNTDSDTGLSLGQTLLYTALGVAAAGGLFFLGRKVYRTLASGAEEKRSLDADSAASYAKRVRMAFDNDGWWGTDEEALRQVLREVPSQGHWQQIGASYQRLYGSPLMRDMESELTSSEYAEMIAIIASKPQRPGQHPDYRYQAEQWAKRLKAAFEDSNWIFPGTDEEAVKAVFSEIPSRSVYQLVEDSYRNMYGSGLEEDLRSEMWDYRDYLDIITSKPY